MPEGEPEDPVAFQARYFGAWDAADLEATAACLDEAFSGSFAGPGAGPAEVLDRAGALERIGPFFARVALEAPRWRRTGLFWLRRTADEAVCAMRVDCRFPRHPEWNNAELTLETYRRGSDGRFRIVRVSSERLR